MFGPCTQYLPAVAGTAKTVALTRATRNDVFPKFISISESSLSNQNCVRHFVPKLKDCPCCDPQSGLIRSRIIKHPWGSIRAAYRNVLAHALPQTTNPELQGSLGFGN